MLALLGTSLMSGNKDGLAIALSVRHRAWDALCLHQRAEPGLRFPCAWAHRVGFSGSSPCTLSAPYIRHNRIPMEGYERVNYRSFNDFFHPEAAAQSALHIDMDAHSSHQPLRRPALTAYPIAPASSRFDHQAQQPMTWRNPCSG